MRRKIKNVPATAAAVKAGRERWLVPTLCAGLVLLVWFVFGQTRSHPFAHFDDNEYIFQNETVMRGLTWQGVGWAMYFGEIGHWHPLTWLSHMLDCELFGLNAGGHHVVNVLWHAAATVLLLVVLRRMTGSVWRSAFVAAVFAAHPLRVESVAWIAERKDVLAAFFFMLTLLMYLRYVERPSRGRYLAVLGTFVLGLLSKNMLVTLPFVLLLLDYWPLKRTVDRSALLKEKIPLLLLSLGSCVATLLAPEKLLSARLPLFVRLENAIVSYVTYLRQTFWPVDLVCLYPNPTGVLPWGEVLVGGLILLVVTLLAVVWRRQRPYLFVGWFWFVGMLLPVIGLVQISSYAHADRYTYLPQIGLLVLLTWSAAALTAGRTWQRWVCGVPAILLIGGLAVRARDQVRYWADDELMWRHTVQCTSSNAIAESNLGTICYSSGKLAEAIEHLRKAVEYSPQNPGARYNLGSALSDAGQQDEAIRQLTLAVTSAPDVKTHFNLANAYYRKGDKALAAVHYEKCLQLQADVPNARQNLIHILLEQGQLSRAIAHYEQLLKIQPDNAFALERLAFIRSTCPVAAYRDAAKAVALAQRANESARGQDALVLRTLAAAFAEGGRFEEALTTAQRGLALAAAQANKDLAEELSAELLLYQARRPLRDPSLVERADRDSIR